MIAQATITQATVSNSLIFLQLNIKIGEYICYKDNNGRKLGRLLAILNDDNSYKLKVQRILTYNELPRQFQSNFSIT
jgi:hypothetical protein